jgi:hypothetical protein
MIFWALLTYGITLIITGSKITESFRRRIGSISKATGQFLCCPMCVGWWVGLGISLLGIGLCNIHVHPIFQHLADAFCSSAWCCILHVTLTKLGAEEL